MAVIPIQDSGRSSDLIASQQGNGRCETERIAQAAKERLNLAAYPPVRNVSCEYHDGVLVLHGQVPTFFQKQLAQEAVANLDGVRQVVNQVEVVGHSKNCDEWV